MAKKKSPPIAAIVVALAIVAVGIFFGTKLIHKCDGCGKTFFGTGYDGNKITQLVNDEEQIFCRECAEKQHAIENLIGKNIDDYKRPLF